MSATTGVTNAGPMTGRYCKPSSGAVCGMATGGVTVVAAAANGVGAAAADVVARLAGLVSPAVRPNSCRAAAIIIHGNGESNGAVGELPASGLRTALTTLDIAVVTTMTGGCGRCFGVSTTTSAMFGTEDTVTLVVGAGSSAALGASAFLVSSAVFTDSVAARTVRAAAVPAFSVFPLGSWVDCRDALDFFVFFGVDSVAAAFASLESVVVSDFSPCCCLFSDDAAPDLDSDDDADPDVVDGSADATPCPTKTAAPIPRATANPPIRPTYAPAPMRMYIPSADALRPRLRRDATIRG